MGVSLQVEVDAEEAERRLDLLQERIRDLRPVFLESVIPILLDMEVNLFESEGVIATPPWSPLSAFTLMEKAKAGFGDMPIMQRTMRLYDSLTGLTPDTHLRVLAQEMTWGTTVPYAEKHQVGELPLPVRQVIPDPVPTEVVDDIEELIDRWVSEV